MRLTVVSVTDGTVPDLMPGQNGTDPMAITPEHIQELFRRLPAAADQMRMILLEDENRKLTEEVERLRAQEAVIPD
jgi:hypothetical protein|tara:strand:- start:426 stop:653 length:228 start_codon:yes stop_codon:yes gene_type:complete